MRKSGENGMDDRSAKNAIDGCGSAATGTLHQEDRETVARQIGRKPLGLMAVARRCQAGKPQVVTTYPLQAQGDAVEVFPTLYWLTCPYLRLAVGRLESEGWVRRLQEEAERNSAMAKEIEKAHKQYARERVNMVSPTVFASLQTDHPAQARVIVESGVGGNRGQGLKCLHAHLAHYLARGQNPVGRQVVDLLTEKGIGVEYCGGEQAYARCWGEKREAVIDIGTNSTRLLVAWRQGGEWHEVLREVTVTRLGEGLSQKGMISQRASYRTLACLRRYRDRAQQAGAKYLHLVGTSALREARNRDEFIHKVKADLGLDVTVISGKQEAFLSFAGAVRTLHWPQDRKALVIDIGGGSTEFIAGKPEAKHPTLAVSAGVGAVRLLPLWQRVSSELALSLSQPGYVSLETSPDCLVFQLKDNQTAAVLAGEKDVPELRPLLEAAEQGLRRAGIDFSRLRGIEVIAVGGTATSLAAIDQELSVYDAGRVHGYMLRREKVRQLLLHLAALSERERKQVRGLQPERADVIVPGTAILLKCMELLDVQAVHVSDADLLQGVLYHPEMVAEG